MMVAVTQPDTQQESVVVGNTTGCDPTQQTPLNSAKQPRVDMITKSAFSSQQQTSAWNSKRPHIHTGVNADLDQH